MLTTYEISLLRQLATSYPNYYDTASLGLADDNTAYINSMLRLEGMGYVESGLIETGTAHVVSNPKLTLQGKQYLEGLQT